MIIMVENPKIKIVSELHMTRRREQRRQTEFELFSSTAVDHESESSQDVDHQVNCTMLHVHQSNYKNYILNNFMLIIIHLVESNNL